MSGSVELPFKLPVHAYVNRDIEQPGNYGIASADEVGIATCDFGEHANAIVAAVNAHYGERRASPVASPESQLISSTAICALEAAESFLVDEQSLEQRSIDEWQRLYPKFPWKEDHQAIVRFNARSQLIERIRTALQGREKT